ncbi:hypothetical protein FA13DRAFT_1788424 [Coprinellus micaceus]|uniref:RING-type domain-containing protein n=1 Tax=Coprinellus micaceus TaxID=71717 RepID=A0A4Y7TNQ3_COPMI|nr:hypothetical protein FA13DRAFT_1788424 [Coprinellus micaceus]
MVGTGASAGSSSKCHVPIQRGASGNKGKGREKTHEEGSLKDITDYLNKLGDAAARIGEELKQLRERNRELEDELAVEKESADIAQHTRRRSTPAAISKLEADIKELKKENKRKDRTIANLKAKEIKAEAEDLLDTIQDPETGEDTPAKMRKLLRKFGDLMLASTLGEDEKCVVCMEGMELKQCSAFSCGHILCNDCIKQILPKNDHNTFTCPMCRQGTDRDEFEVVYMTETDRWDALLKIAQAWGAIDHRPAIDTSEEEGEESFLAEDSGNDGTSSEGPRDDQASEDNASRAESDGQEQDECGGTSTPESSSPLPRLPYAASPMKEKRKRLAELAERASKRRR